MKSKLIILSMLFAGVCATVNAQDAEENYYTKKWTDNIYVGAGIGGMAVFNDGMNTPTFNMNITVGKQITPTWGVRAQVGGFWQSLDDQDGRNNYHAYCKKFGEINLDATLSLTNLILGYSPERALDFYAFAGPTMNISKAVNGSYEFSGTNTPGTTTKVEGDWTFAEDGTKARLGATAGLGLAYNVNENWAVNVEGRFGVTPSIFGYGSNCRTAEATGRLTLGVAYTIGGKKFAKVEDRIVEKIVEKEIIKEVPVEVIKEVIKEIPASGAAAIFFKIGKAAISAEGMVNVKLMAKIMKDSPNTKYKVAGFADKGTGSAKTNQTLSEKRAQAVFDALVAEGVNPDQLEPVGMGGTDPMFEKGYLNRVVILEVK